MYNCSSCKLWEKDEDYPIGVCKNKITLREYIKSFENGKDTPNKTIVLTEEDIYTHETNICTNYKKAHGA